MYVKKIEHKKRIKQDLNSCTYNPIKPNILQMDNGTIKIINPHDNCLHNHYCIFNKNRHNLESNIIEIENKLTQFQEMKEDAINGIIRYHEELDPYYTITNSKYTGIDGKEHRKIDVTTDDKFIAAINRKIENLKYDLKNLLNFRIDVIHGKIEGYSYDST